MYHVKGYSDNVDFKAWINRRNKEEKRSKSKNEAFWEKELATFKDKCLSDDENPPEHAIVTRWDKARLAKQKEEEKEKMARPSNKEILIKKLTAERDELTDKILGLDTKLLEQDSDLSDIQFYLMNWQRNAMDGYRQALSARIKDLEAK